MRALISLLALVAVTLAADLCQAAGPYFEVPPGPRTSWRGRISIRNGPILFGSRYRERWGSGITPAGAQVLTTAITTSPQILVPLLGGVSPTQQAAPSAEEGTEFEAEAARQDLEADLDADAAAHRDAIATLRTLQEQNRQLYRELTGQALSTVDVEPPPIDDRPPPPPTGDTPTTTPADEDRLPVRDPGRRPGER